MLSCASRLVSGAAAKASGKPMAATKARASSPPQREGGQTFRLQRGPDILENRRPPHRQNEFGNSQRRAVAWQCLVDGFPQYLDQGLGLAPHRSQQSIRQRSAGRDSFPIGLQLSITKYSPGLGDRLVQPSGRVGFLQDGCETLDTGQGFHLRGVEMKNAFPQEARDWLSLPFDLQPQTSYSQTQAGPARQRRTSASSGTIASSNAGDASTSDHCA